MEEPTIVTLSSDDENETATLSEIKSQDQNLSGNYNKFLSFLSKSTCSRSDEQSAQEFSKGFVSVNCPGALIGSYAAVPVQRLELWRQSFIIYIPSLIDQKPVKLIIQTRAIVQLLVHLGEKMPAFIIYAYPSMAAYIRQKLGMASRRMDAFLDPKLQDQRVKRIIFLMEPLNSVMKSAINKFFDKGHFKDNERFGCIWEIDHNKTVQVVAKSFGDSKENTLNLKERPPLQTLLVYPPPPQKGGITVTTDDFCCLEEEQFLNDVIIDFYLKWLLLTEMDARTRERTHVFSTFFYKRLTSRPKRAERRPHAVEDDPFLTQAQKRHTRVASWTKGVDIFEKDFIIVPINDDYHWFLAIICFPSLNGPVYVSDGSIAQPPRSTNRIKKDTYRPPSPNMDADDPWNERDEAESDEETSDSDDEPTKTAKTLPFKKALNEPVIQPCILIFDSLIGSLPLSRIVSTLRSYLAIEFATRKGGRDVSSRPPFTRHTIKGYCPKVPQQNNFSDCGLYTLQYAESFLRDPWKNSEFPLRLENMFCESQAAGKRAYVACLIRRLTPPSRLGAIPRLNLPSRPNKAEPTSSASNATHWGGPSPPSETEGASNQTCRRERRERRPPK